MATTAMPWNDDGGSTESGFDDTVWNNSTTTAADTVLLPTTRPPFSDRQNRMLQYFTTFAPIPSWIGSGLILYVLWRERRSRVLKHSQTYNRLILGLSFYDFTWSFHFTIFGGHWTIPKIAVDWVVGAHADTFFWCNIAGVFFYQVYGTVLYSCSLMLFFVMEIQWSWSKHFIERRIEPIMHVISNLVPWIFGLFAVASQSIAPNPEIPGICTLFEWPPHCETDANPVPCTHGGSRQITILSGLVSASMVALWMIILIGSLISLTRKVWAIEQRMREYASGELERDPSPMTRHTAVRGILYITSFFICIIPVVPQNFQIWDLNEEYGHIHFTLGVINSFLTVNLGIFNACIYLQPNFAQLTLPSGTLWFLHPIRQAFEKYSCCVAFWTCQCCHCCVKTALASSFLQSSGSTSLHFSIERRSISRQVNARLEPLRRSSFIAIAPELLISIPDDFQDPSDTSAPQTDSVEEQQHDAMMEMECNHSTNSMVSPSSRPGIPISSVSLHNVVSPSSRPGIPIASVSLHNVKLRKKLYEPSREQLTTNAHDEEIEVDCREDHENLDGSLSCSEVPEPVTQKTVSNERIQNHEILDGSLLCSEKLDPQGVVSINLIPSQPVKNDRQVVLDDSVEDSGWDQAPLYAREGHFHESCVAPAGPLRFTIKASPHGPVVCSVSCYSAVRECVHVGDIVVAIDNISTRWMAVENVAALLVATHVLPRRITVERHMQASAILERQEMEVVFVSSEELLP